MANKSCQSCADLQNDAPNLIVNGMTEAECTSLKNDTGLNPASGNNDCTDLDNMNDCLIGNMVEEIDAYDVCEWKDYTKNLVDNTWTVFKGVICSVCGLWTNVHNIWTKINQLSCYVDLLSKGATFDFGEYVESTTKSYIVAGKGVSFANVSASGTSNDILITYVAGGTSSLTGSCKFYASDFTDAKSVSNYDNRGVNPTTSSARSGNTRWNTDGYLGAGGELVYELRILKSEYPQILRFWNGVINEGAGGAYNGRVLFRNEGTYAPGQQGDCNTLTGEPVDSSSDRGHLVPPGWMYIQVRMLELRTFGASGSQYTPVAIIPIRINMNGIEC